MESFYVDVSYVTMSKEPHLSEEETMLDDFTCTCSLEFLFAKFHLEGKSFHWVFRKNLKFCDSPFCFFLDFKKFDSS